MRIWDVGILDFEIILIEMLSNLWVHRQFPCRQELVQQDHLSRLLN